MPSWFWWDLVGDANLAIFSECGVLAGTGPLDGDSVGFGVILKIPGACFPEVLGFEP